jgi:hypothetical protein
MSLGSYSPAVDVLLAKAPCNELGPGRPDLARRAELAALSAESLLAPHAVQDREMAAACLAALWLRHGFLDESHRISQDLHTTTGSYWHGIMHRREPDYSNAKYWFHRVGHHPVFEPLADAVGSLAADAPAEAAPLVEQSTWDPFAFVDLCQRAARGSSDLRAFCARIQQREWELLFDHCYRRAIGND